MFREEQQLARESSSRRRDMNIQFYNTLLDDASKLQ